MKRRLEILIIFFSFQFFITAHTPELNLPQRPNHLELVPQTNLSKAGSFMVSFKNENKKKILVLTI